MSLLLCALGHPLLNRKRYLLCYGGHQCLLLFCFYQFKSRIPRPVRQMDPKTIENFEKEEQDLLATLALLQEDLSKVQNKLKVVREKLLKADVRRPAPPAVRNKVCPAVAIGFVAQP